MARKKPGQKKTPAQPIQEVSDKLLEDLLGEWKLEGPDGEAGGEMMEVFEASPASELLEVLAAAGEPPTPQPQVEECTAPEGGTAQALAAMQTAIEQVPEQVEFATLSEPLVPAHREEAEGPECLPATSPLPLAVADEQIVEEAHPQPVSVPLEEALPAPAVYELLPVEDIDSGMGDAESESEPEAVQQASAPAAFSRRDLVAPQEEAASEDQPDVLSRLVAGIDTRVAATPVWNRKDDEEEEEAVEAYAAFHLSGTAFAVPVGAIREIDRVAEITPVPNLPSFIPGVINLRGDVTCVLDLRSYIGLAPSEDHESGWLLVVSGTETRRSLALLVDDMSSLVRISAAKVKPPTGKVEDRVIPLLAGVVEQRDRVIGVLSVDSLLESPDVRELWM